MLKINIEIGGNAKKNSFEGRWNGNTKKKSGDDPPGLH